MGDTRRPRVKAYLCNNPRWRTTLRNPVTGEAIPIEAFPSLSVDLGDLPSDGVWSVGATAFGHEQHELVTLESTVASQNRRLRWSWDLDEPVADPWTIHVWARQDSYLFEETAGLRINRLSGKVTDFDGRPIQGVVCANGVRGVAAPTDDAGRYSLWLPDGHILSLLAADAGYGEKTLQCWVYDYRPEGDFSLDMRVGQCEIYELNAWRGYCGIKVDFIPMSVGMVRSLFVKGRACRSKAGEVFGPELSPCDVSVEVDGVAADILSMHRREEIMRTEKMVEPGLHSRAEYSLQVADPGASPDDSHGGCQVLRVTIRHRFVEAGRSLLEQGEGFFLGLRSGVGISGGTSRG